MTRTGVDYAHGTPSPAALKAAGHSFVCRYVSTSGNDKNLRAEEARILRAAGLDILVVFERDATRPLGGAAAGRADGASARAQADQLGAPARSAIYAAVDFDPQPGQMGAVLNYLDAFAVAVRPHPAGVYGGYRVIAAAETRVPYLWQAGAWSTWTNPATGKREYHLHPSANLRQHAGTVTVDGVACDLNTALKPAIGGWAEPLEDDMGLTDEDKAWIEQGRKDDREENLKQLLRLARWTSGKASPVFTAESVGAAPPTLSASGPAGSYTGTITNGTVTLTPKT